MVMKCHFLLLIFLALGHALSIGKAHPRTYARVSIKPEAVPLTPSYGIDTLNSSSFPTDFVFGAASSAYQVEGAWDEQGKGPSIWDSFTHNYPEKIANESNGDVATDSYHRYKEDVEILKTMNLDAYRFSISWSRILPYGKLSKGINEEGIQHYNSLINELVGSGLKPYVTLFHWDLPQALEDENGGFLNPWIVDDYRDYAELCFKRFGDRVKNWITFNEPWSYSTGGYVNGSYAPGRCSHWLNSNCSGGNSGTEPYLVAHYQLLAHAYTVKLYKQKYQALQNGKIGITLVAAWLMPYSNSLFDHHATQRSFDFMVGWFMEPLTRGGYPRTMRSLVGTRLPRFTEEQSKILKGSFDFIGLNYYTAFFVSHVSSNNTVNLSYDTDSQSSLRVDRNGTLIGEPGGSGWLHVYPRGLYDILFYIKRKYNNPLIYITENGIDEVNNVSLSLEHALIDNFRITYHYLHLSSIHNAIKDGANVMAYFVWSIMDNFEWTVGYTSRFGFYYIDYLNHLKKHPKLSAKWLSNFLQKQHS